MGLGEGLGGGIDRKIDLQAVREARADKGHGQRQRAVVPDKGRCHFECLQREADDFRTAGSERHRRGELLDGKLLTELASAVFSHQADRAAERHVGIAGDRHGGLIGITGIEIARLEEGDLDGDGHENLLLEDRAADILVVGEYAEIIGRELVGGAETDFEFAVGIRTQMRLEGQRRREFAADDRSGTGSTRLIGGFLRLGRLRNSTGLGGHHHRRIPRFRHAVADHGRLLEIIFHHHPLLLIEEIEIILRILSVHETGDDVGVDRRHGGLWQRNGTPGIALDSVEGLVPGRHEHFRSGICLQREAVLSAGQAAVLETGQGQRQLRILLREQLFESILLVAGVLEAQKADAHFLRPRGGDLDFHPLQFAVCRPDDLVVEPDHPGVVNGDGGPLLTVAGAEREEKTAAILLLRLREDIAEPLGQEAAAEAKDLAVLLRPDLASEAVCPDAVEPERIERIFRAQRQGKLLAGFGRTPADLHGILLRNIE